MTTDTRDVDLAWAVDEDMPPGPYPRDSRYLFKRVPQLITEATTRGAPQRVLDIACGLGGQLELFRDGKREAWGLDASMALVTHCKQRLGDERTPFVCAVAESLPFQDNSFDRVVCQGSLDHFVKPRAFVGEVARILKPDGRAVLGIYNYDSLACRIGKGAYNLSDAGGRDVYHGRNFWDIPLNHTFRGTYDLLMRMGEPHLELVECRGISLFWLLRRWTKFIEALPYPLAWSTLAVMDRIAYHTPSIADMLVSVWQPRKAS